MISFDIVLTLYACSLVCFWITEVKKKVLVQVEVLVYQLTVTIKEGQDNIRIELLLRTRV